MARSIDEILAAADDPAYHRVAVARIPMISMALRDEHDRLDTLLPTLTSDTIDSHPDLTATIDRLAEIEAEMDAATIEFRFRSIGNRAWMDLLREHPPTRQQLAEDKRLDHNPDTFPYEAMAASCIDPVMTADDVRQLERTPLCDVQAWNALWSACLKANVVSAAPKSLAVSILRASGESARRHTITESLAASSSAE